MLFVNSSDKSKEGLSNQQSTSWKIDFGPVKDGREFGRSFCDI